MKKKGTPRMAHYHYFYELYKQKMHYRSALKVGHEVTKKRR